MARRCGPDWPDVMISKSGVRAAGDGKVYAAGWDTADHKSFGLHVRIDHEGGYRTIYGHLSATSVRKGTEVQGGRVIGISGNTGNVSPAPAPGDWISGRHLHFSAYRLKDDRYRAVNPYG